MAGRGKTRDSQALPKGNSGVYGGTTDPQPGDEQQGGWSRQQREEMDQRFTDAMVRALRSGQAAAAPPSAASNSRRPMVTVIRPSRARCVKGNDTTPRTCGLHVQGAECWLLPP